MLGVATQTVSSWFGNNSSNGNTSAPAPDARVKVPPQAKEQLAERVEDGEPVAQVAADYLCTAFFRRNLLFRNR